MAERAGRAGAGATVLLGPPLALLLTAIAVGDARAQGCAEPVAHLVSLVGDVRVNGAPPVGEPPSIAVCAGDTVEVGQNSRAGAYLLGADTPLQLEEETLARFQPPAQPGSGLVDLARGAIYLLSEVRRTLTVRTPYVTAGVEGTEFYLRADRPGAEGGAELLVLEGRVALTPGERTPSLVRQAASTGERLQVAATGGVRRTALPGGDGAYAALRRVTVGELAWTLFYPDVLVAEEAQAFPRIARAAQLLAVGQVTDAEAALADVPDRGGREAALRDALRATIAFARKDARAALRLAEAGRAAAPGAATPLVALSYARQLALDLDGAVAAAGAAAEAAPRSSLPHARLAELRLMQGQTRAARREAGQAKALGGGALADIVLGYAELAALRGRAAEAAFRQALAAESSNPLALLGLGLAHIKQGYLEEGRQQIENAVAHDPSSSLLRSYLGKGYFEERRDDPARKQLAIAKDLDPTDPTPWLYDALRKELGNQPVTALRDLERSIALNDNRAPFRSRLLLDQDAASRAVGLGRIFGTLGFSQLGVNEAARSLATDPASSSAHRFLADLYLDRPRSEYAYFSERLQTLLLQPPLRVPVPPQLGPSDLSELARLGPRSSGINEYQALFERNGLGAAINTRLGSQETRNGETIISALADNVAISAGALRAESDGFRPDNEVRREVQNLFGQIALTPELSFQAEYRARELDRGNLRFDLDPDRVDDTEKAHVDERTGRIGMHYAPTPSHDFVWSFAASDRDTRDESFDPDFGEFFTLESRENGAQFEALHQWRVSWITLLSGAGADRFNLGEDRDFNRQFAYVRVNLPVTPKLLATVGLHGETFEDQRLGVDDKALQPQAGLFYQAHPRLTLRAAFAKQRKPRLIAKETLMPTQVAGFTRFFDDANASLSRLYGVGADFRLHEAADGSTDLYAGVELTRRNIDRPTLLGTDDAEQAIVDDLREDAFQGYIYGLVSDRIALTLEPRYEDTRCGDLCGLDVKTLNSWFLPVAARYFAPNGLYAAAEYTWIRQDLERSSGEFDKETFGVLDLSLGWRLPNRYAVVQFEARNVLGEDFDYQDDSFRATDPLQSPYIPERGLFLSLNVQF